MAFVSSYGMQNNLKNGKIINSFGPGLHFIGFCNKIMYY